jgi:hypothetical protein
MEAFIPGIVLGIGVNSAAKTLHAPAIENVVLLPDIIGASGQIVAFSIEQLSASASLSQQLNVSTSASLKYASTGSGSMSAQFVNNIKQNSFSIYIVVRTLVINSEKVLDLSRIRLQDDAAGTWVNQPSAFVEQYGDAFVYGVVTGGEFFAVLEIQTESADEYREVKASLSGKGQFGLFSGNASASFSETLGRITTSYQMRATVIRRGGVGALLQAITADELRDRALAFPGEVAGQNGYPYGALLHSYNHIEHPIAEPLSVQQRADALDRLGRLREQFVRMQNDLEFAANHPWKFPGIDLDRVNERFNALSQQIEVIVAAARRIFSSSNDLEFPEINMSLLSPVLPQQIGGPMEERLRELERQVEALRQITRHFDSVGDRIIVRSEIVPTRGLRQPDDSGIAFYDDNSNGRFIIQNYGSDSTISSRNDNGTGIVRVNNLRQINE